MKYEYIIIGAGLSALSAAITLTQKFPDKKILILEKNKYAGGRVFSYKNKYGTFSDNGQHIIIKGYKNTIKYLKIIGSLDKINFEKQVDFPVMNNKKNIFFINSYFLFNYKHITFKNKVILIFQFFKMLKDYIFKKNDLKKIVLYDWLEKNNNNEELTKYFWNLFAESAVNASIKEISAYSLFYVIIEGFLENPFNNGFGLPKEDLSSIFIKPAIKYLNDKKVEIKNNVKIKKTSFKDNKILFIEDEKQNKYYAENFISSIPPNDLDELLELNSDLKKIRNSNILSAEISFKQVLPIPKYLSFTDYNIQWIFNKTKLNRLPLNKTVINIVISNANRFLNKNYSEIKKILMKEIKEIFDLKHPKLEYFHLYFSKNATVISDIEFEKIRKVSDNPKYTNLQIIGDWTNTNIPPTIESAITSGKEIYSTKK